MDREWAIPVLLGLLTATALWFVPSDDDGADGADGGDPDGPTGTGSSSGSTSRSGNPAIVLPFDEGRAPGGTELSFLVLAPRGQSAALAEVNRSAHPAARDDLHWQQPKLAFYEVTVSDCDPAVACDPYWAFGPWPLPKTYEASTGPRLGVDGYNGTRITIHVFDESGLLAATNAPAEQTEAFIGGSQPQELPGGVWYVGANATAPNGTRPVPGMARPLFDQLKPIMQGLPVGGVATVRSDAYASVYGPLYVTVRIDELVQAH